MRIVLCIILLLHQLVLPGQPFDLVALLSGDTIEGKVYRISDSRVKMLSGSERVTIPTSEVIDIYFVRPGLNVDHTDNGVYLEITDSSGLSQEQLYFRAMEWYVNTFAYPDEVIQVSDKETGLIIGKCTAYWDRLLILTLYEYQITYTLKVEIRDNRFRIVVTNILVAERQNKDVGFSGVYPIENHLVYKFYNRDGGIRDDADWLMSVVMKSLLWQGRHLRDTLQGMFATSVDQWD